MDLIGKLKLDLHTHVFEEILPVSPRMISVQSVKRIIEKVKSAGLDGIAITEHNTFDYGYRVKEICDQQFSGQILVIPGREVEDQYLHIVELDITADGSKIFRFVAHPGYPGTFRGETDRFKGIEIANSMHNWHIDKPWVKEFAEKHNLMTLSNSDAHYLRDVGKHFSEVSLEDLGF